MSEIQLSLISHTNLGKTTLARTLLRRDVGEVRDEAHVTLESERYPLVEAGEDTLVLWDTPGFGDSARVVQRLRGRANPVGWFLSQVWDRLADRALWSGQQAAATVRDHADAVLYLVSAGEDPRWSGYVDAELELLSWIGRPVLVLLNQTGDPREAKAQEERWRRYLKDRSEEKPIVRDVLSLDAFTRCWVQEGILLERVERHLPEARRDTMERLRTAWNERNGEVFRAAVARLADYLAGAAVARRGLDGARPSKAEKQRAMERLAEGLDTATARLMDGLIADHGLTGASSKGLEKRIDDYLVKGTTDLTAERGALLGGVLSGALGGLVADLLAGGLTFGGGLVAGAILGALGGAGLSRAFELVQPAGEPAVRWSPVFLDQLTRQALLRYLTVAHYGRGRGEYRDPEQPEHWRAPVDEAVDALTDALNPLWKRAAKEGEEARGAIAERLRGLVDRVLRGLLAKAYPEARGVPTGTH
jgi:hypothetical protein